MQTFTHESTRYTVAPENVAKYRAALEKPKKHKPEALSSKNLARQYPAYLHGHTTTAQYVAAFQSQFNGTQHKIEHRCENYYKPAPMLDAAFPECVEDVNPDYVPTAKTKKPAQTVAGLKNTIRAALELIASGDIDSAQCLLNEAVR
jgi:hypothetical protein